MSYDNIQKLLNRKAELDKALEGIHRYLSHSGAKAQNVGDCTGQYWIGFVMPAPYVRQCADLLTEQYTAERKQIREALDTLEKVAKGLVATGNDHAAKP